MDVDDLYGAPLEQFIAKRGQLTRGLREQGEREQAATVAKLRKPSVAAWAVNQLVRTQPQSVAELFDAGDALREAHRTATAGRGDGSALRTAAQSERTAVDVLVKAARGLLTSEGHELTPAIIDRVADTLRAAALDTDSRELVRDGRLERELRHVGLGVAADTGAGLAPPSPPSRRQPKRRTPATEAGDATATKEAMSTSAAKKEAERHEQQAEGERLKRERTRALKVAREVEAKARRRAERTSRAVRTAHERRDRAAEDLDYAEKSLAAAEAEADAAAAEHRRAQDELERL
jgi:hypothetical protein